ARQRVPVFERRAKELVVRESADLADGSPDAGLAADALGRARVLKEARSDSRAGDEQDVVRVPGPECGERVLDGPLRNEALLSADAELDRTADDLLERGVGKKCVRHAAR